MNDNLSEKLRGWERIDEGVYSLKGIRDPTASTFPVQPASPPPAARSEIMVPSHVIPIRREKPPVRARYNPENSLPARELTLPMSRPRLLYHERTTREGPEGSVQTTAVVTEHTAISVNNVNAIRALKIVTIELYGPEGSLKVHALLTPRRRLHGHLNRRAGSESNRNEGTSRNIARLECRWQRDNRQRIPDQSN
ncbi:hypothetical protein EVAR_74508_1 [Eumeta japonica]|uniref:Uncharacterized protein n=1 Tax=Eumeta variegata TaxID=151549 RepID=A0A4C1TE67_EUMVA|nr:hypothetical protein EVAR_74508_1 [Eumeta japonica]